MTQTLAGLIVIVTLVKTTPYYYIKRQLYAPCINHEGRMHIFHSKLVSMLDGSTSDSHENWIR